MDPTISQPLIFIRAGGIMQFNTTERPILSRFHHRPFQDAIIIQQFKSFISVLIVDQGASLKNDAFLGDASDNDKPMSVKQQVHIDIPVSWQQVHVRTASSIDEVDIVYATSTLEADGCLVPKFAIFNLKTGKWIMQDRQFFQESSSYLDKNYPIAVNNRHQNALRSNDVMLVANMCQMNGNQCKLTARVWIMDSKDPHALTKDIVLDHGRYDPMPGVREHPSNYGPSLGC